MLKPPPRDPDLADAAPTDPELTPYDYEHMITYLRLMDAAADSADWHDIAQIVLHIDPDRGSERARRAYETHYERAQRMSLRATGFCCAAG